MLARFAHRRRSSSSPWPGIAAFGVVASLCVAVPASADSPSASVAPPPPTGTELHPNDRPGEAREFFLRKRSQDGGAIDPQRYRTALTAMQGMPRFASPLARYLPSRAELAGAATAVEPSLTTLWTPLGPGNVGGRIRRLVIHPTTPGTMWAAAVDGGVWKTTNGGGAWAPTGDFLPNLAFSSLAISPADPATLYAGSGEGFFNGDAVRGAGVFKTSNGGGSWAQLASTNNSNFFAVNDVAVSKGNPNRVYAGTGNGVWRSLDGGASWTQILAPNVQGGCTDLALRSDLTNDVLFAACGIFTQSAVWRNKNAEATGAWTKVLRETGMGRTALAIAPSKQGVIYALASSIKPGNFQFGLLAVFRSDNGGDSWSATVRNTSSDRASTLLLTNPVFASLVQCSFGASNVFLNQGWYDNVIAVDPKDPNRVYAGGIDVFVSTDGAKTFRPTSFWWADQPLKASFVHADNHDLVFAPAYNGTTNKTLFIANDGGVFKTANARATPSPTLCDPTKSAFSFVNLNRGLEATQFYDGIAYPDDTAYFGGTQDNGTVRGTIATGRNGWSRLLGGDGGAVALDPGNTNVLYAENTGLSIQKSTNGGGSFADAVTGIADSGFAFIAPFIMDPSSAQRLWTGGFRVWRTTNGAASWVAASTALGSGRNQVSAIAIAPNNPNAALVGLSQGKIARNAAALSANGSTGWAQASPRAGFVSSLAFDPDDSNVAYATYSTFGGVHVWKSIDAGATWSPLDGSGAGRLPDLPAHVLRIDPDNTAHLFLGTDLGVFVSVDGGQTWAVEATGFPNVVTEALRIQGDTLVAFTHGRGAWKTTISH